MKMASNQRKGDDNTSLMAKYDTLKKEHEAAKKTNRALESRIDKLMTWAEKTNGKKLD
jgi:predicted  nucleic acid-binding Zn-ribbon protein